MMREWAVACLAGLFLTGCDEQKVLYEAKSPEPIPPVAAQVAAQQPSMPPHAGMMSGGAGSAADIPEPVPADFTEPADHPPATIAEAAAIRVPVPEDWQRQQPTSTMRVLQYEVPAETGDPAEFIAFYFGPNQGGTMMDNVARWVGQFSGNDTVREFSTDDDVNGLRVTRLKLAGTWSGGMMPGMAPGQVFDNWMMDALIVEGGPQGSVFFRLTGPGDAVEAQDAAVDMMAAGVTIAGQPDPDSQPPQAEPDEELELSLVQAPGVEFAIPSYWVQSAAPTGMRALQFEIPAHAGEEPAEFVVFHFGKGGGGSVEDNIARWSGQVTGADGVAGPQGAEIETTDIDEFKVTSVYKEGQYTATSMSPMAPAPSPKAGWALMGMVVEGGSQGPIYIRVTGPAAVVRAHRDELGVVLKTLKQTQ